jgi:antitoxin FitA
MVLSGLRAAFLLNERAFLISCYHKCEVVPMTQILVRDIDEETKRRLQRRAKRHGRSMEAEIRDILRDAAKQPDISAKGLGTDIAGLFKRIGLGPDEDIREWKGIEVKDPFAP